MIFWFENNETIEAVSRRTRLDKNSGGIVVDLPGHRSDIKTSMLITSASISAKDEARYGICAIAIIGANRIMPA